MTYPPVIIVDDHDRPTGVAMLADAWREGLVHRSVLVMVEDGQGNILLQKRSLHMQLYPGRWDNSAAGHVDEGMTYHDAALQEVIEELGIAPTGLAEIGYLYTDDVYEGRIMKQFRKVYRLKYTQGTPTTQEEHEVTELRWFPIEEAKQMLAAQPELFSAGLRHVLERLY
ncbi:MAG TPA: NUDIX domain-containing protein [Candidatus Saccharimonadales bacterium]|nr:NUDIX domain-containing protein [Candidatus Saccharimonadales bacterium]